MKHLLCLLAILSNINSHSQPLHPGDTLPVNLLESIGYNKKPETKNGLLILDFMSLGCISCLHALPKMDALQQRFGFSVLLVTPDKKEKISSFLQKNAFGKKIRFPIIAEDTLLKSYFPHQFISHIAWIYNNRVVAITRSDYLNEANLSALLSGAAFSLPVKQDRVNYNYEQTLLPPLADSSTVSSQLLTYMDGVPRRFRTGVDSATGRQWVRIINYALVDIYRKSFGFSLSPQQSQLLLQVADTATFLFDKQKHYRQQWNEQNTYCYEASFPAAFTIQQCLQWIRADLDNRFRLRTCLINTSLPTIQISQSPQ